ncbi:hypothetical protein [Candidatus Pyrohabitans sp.]
MTKGDLQIFPDLEVFRGFRLQCQIRKEIKSLLGNINKKASESGVAFEIKSVHVNPECCGRRYTT